MVESKLLQIKWDLICCFICQMSVGWSNSGYHLARFPPAENVCALLGF